jgi:hypothetical protein
MKTRSYDYCNYSLNQKTKLQTSLSKNKMIILDLDHTLVHAIDENEIKKNRICKGSFKYTTYDVFMRPHLDKFIYFCCSNYENIIIWSLGTSDYVNYIIKRMFEKYNCKPLLILTREDSKKTESGWEKNTLKIKEKLSEKGINFDNYKFVFVDDIVKRIVCSENVDVIEIKPFYHRCYISERKSRAKRQREDMDDDELLRVMKKIKKQ